MTKRVRIAGLGLGVLALAGALVAGLWRGRFAGWMRSRPLSIQAAIPSQATPPSKPLTSAPSIFLQINSEHELTVISGTPLFFTVRLVNRFAQNAASRNQAANLHREHVRAVLSSGEISPERANQLLANIRSLSEIPLLIVGDRAMRWDQCIHFTLRSPDGREQPLPWPLTVNAPAAPESLTLDAQTMGRVEYVLAPEPAAQLGTGKYEISVVFEVPLDAQQAADHWRGRVESEPVKLTVAQEPDHLEKADEEARDLQLARYYLKVKDSAQALNWSQKALAADSTSIPARTIIGEVKEAQGDVQGAREAYRTARAEFYTQNPESYEAPLYLTYKIANLLPRTLPRKH